jgi:integrase
MTDIMHFAICTAMRQGEIVRLTWEDLNLVDRTIWVRGRKDPTSNKGRDDQVPLVRGPVVINGQTLCPVEIILRQRTAKRRTGRIFPHSRGAVADAFIKATDALGIIDMRFHDLRHDAISRLFEHGYQIPQVALISGHRSWKNLQRYTQIDPTSLHKRLVSPNLRRRRRHRNAVCLPVG